MSDKEGESAAKKMKLEAEPVVAAAPAHCQAWIHRKKRFCKMTVGKKRQYCGEHSVASTEEEDSNRVPCPLDPKHSVDKRNLDKHLQVCNSRKPVDIPEYIKRGCNIGDPAISEETFRLTDVSQEDLDVIVKLINDLFDKNVAGTIGQQIMSHEVLAEELANETYGSEKRKHLLQTSSILGIMKQESYLKPKTCFIEYGAGKAALAFWLATAVKSLESAKVLVVDRASHRHKKDNLIRDRDLVERIRADIADLHLKGLDMIKDCESLVGVSKHLCGGATDLALRCMVQGNEQGVTTSSFLICVCCHHQCSWNTFVGKDWLIANGIDKKAFNIIIKLVSWYTCGDGLGRAKHGTADNDEERKEKEEIGWRCKRILDHARLHYMNAHNYDTKLIFYAEKSTTLENVCIIGKHKN